VLKVIISIVLLRAIVSYCILNEDISFYFLFLHGLNKKLSLVFSATVFHLYFLDNEMIVV